MDVLMRVDKVRLLCGVRLLYVFRLASVKFRIDRRPEIRYHVSSTFNPPQGAP